MLQIKKLCVCELQEILGIAQSSVSHHLKILEGAGLVEHEKCGQWVNYKVNASSENLFAPTMLHHLDSWLESHPDIKRDRELINKTNRHIICKKTAG